MNKETIQIIEQVCKFLIKNNNTESITKLKNMLADNKEVIELVTKISTNLLLSDKVGDAVKGLASGGFSLGGVLSGIAKVTEDNFSISKDDLANTLLSLINKNSEDKNILSIFYDVLTK